MRLYDQATPRRRDAVLELGPLYKGRAGQDIVQIWGEHIPRG